MKHQELNKLQRQYDALPMAEKVRRLEFLAGYYLSLNTNDCKFVVDATKHWPQFQEMSKQAAAIEAGAATMAEVLR
ncbi:hypothetical protein [Pseudomonas sp. P8_250]|uniref:hypothetical protein n=1 Tax=Pseudomonas sp. P8_250 TaxID=3043446 RepID=UPI002A36379E|nr:hypothetical protein [Pseudomonas sp. P8_250]MDX9668705.1 hypothetical protein [Pseudomonas sp. P8_250]